MLRRLGRLQAAAAKPSGACIGRENPLEFPSARSQSRTRTKPRRKERSCWPPMWFCAVHAGIERRILVSLSEADQPLAIRSYPHILDGALIERGVKRIGAASHNVSEELDAGPTLEQDMVRIRPPRYRRGFDPQTTGPRENCVSLRRRFSFGLASTSCGRKTAVFDRAGADKEGPSIFRHPVRAATGYRVRTEIPEEGRKYSL
jgi:hypothetical protein